MSDRPGPAPGIVVVGGGIAGLVTAWELAVAGLRPDVIESRPTLGGCIARHRVGGLDLDAGAESYATATSAVADLIVDLGLQSRIVSPNPLGAWVRHRTGTAPLPKAALLGIPSRPLAADVRRVLGLPGAARAGLDLLLPARIGSGDGSAGSLGALVGTRMGRRVVDRLVEPVAGGVYSTDPDELDVDTVAPRLRAVLQETGSLAGAVTRLRGGGARPGSAVGGLAGGLFTLVESLERAIVSYGGTVSTGVRVTAIGRADVQQDGDLWLVHTSEDIRPATHVVLAVPGPDAVGLLGTAHIQVPETATSDVHLVTLVVDHDGLNSHPRGTGVLVSRHATGVTAKALTHATAKWAWLAEQAGPSRHVLRLSYGRGDDIPSQGAELDGAELDGTELDCGELADLALADASVLTGVRLTRSSLIDSDVIRWTSALPRPQPGHRAAMQDLRTQAGTRSGLHVTGSMIAGTGLAAVVADARSVATAISAGRAAGIAAD